jgi:hypothetical protein
LNSAETVEVVVLATTDGTAEHAASLAADGFSADGSEGAVARANARALSVRAHRARE